MNEHTNPPLGDRGFIIFTTQRSGSTVLTRTLDEHPEIFCAGELFQTSDDMYHPEWHFAAWGMESKSHSVQKINKIINYPNLRFRSIPHVKKFFNSNEKGEKVRGFKLMFTHIKTAPHLWEYLKKRKIKVIVLIRSNVFKTTLSRYRKAENRVAHTAEATAPLIQFYVPGEKLINQMRELERVNKNLLRYTEGMNRLVIHYEDFNHWDELMNKVQKFLNVSPIEMKPVLKKVGAIKWQDEVENFTEIEQLLKQNNFTEYLNQ
jgi:Sulfotransferase family